MSHLRRIAALERRARGRGVGPRCVLFQVAGLSPRDPAIRWARAIQSHRRGGVWEWHRYPTESAPAFVDRVAREIETRNPYGYVAVEFGRVPSPLYD